MKKFLLHFLFALLLFSFESFSQQFVPYYATIVDQCSQTNITNNLTTFESFGVKRRGTPSLQNTLNWLKNQYISYGYTSAQLQEFSYTYQGSSAVCKNLVVTKLGTLYPNSYVIVCGHYDSITGTGTNDNGSGTVALLEIARLLRTIPTEYSIKFINFSGEEDGLKGSQNFVNTVVNGTSPKMDIKIVFNLDEIGGDASLTNDTITCERDTGSPTSNNDLSNQRTQELITCTELYTDLNTFLNYAYASDYMTFEENGEIITGFFETNETPHRHTDTDLLENMDPVYNYNVAKAAIGATMHFAKAATSTLGNNDFIDDEQVSFFPSPTQTVLNISLGSLTETNYNFSLVDLQGKTVLSKAIENASLIETISLQGLSKGMHLAVLQTATKRITKKILIQ